jgi:uncharacterized protein YcbK (DUF882 family)
VRAALAVTLAITGLAAAAFPAAAEYKAKKDVERAQKSAKHAPPPAAGLKATKLVNLYNQWTHDWLAVDASEIPSVTQVDQFLRDHFTNEATTMDPKLVGVVVAAATQFKSDFVAIVSGFRHPKYNLMLRKKGRQVARDSQHTHGNAIDFRIPTVAIQKLHEWAKGQKVGGVGIYLTSGFVHMDTGPIRFWSGD